MSVKQFRVTQKQNVRILLETFSVLATMAILEMELTVLVRQCLMN